ncbi:MAG: tRNA pseudouridine(54/55) synthase Pus10 [Planctomycetota bacterium]
MSTASLCLESRYRKLVRGLPQTIFFCPVCKGDRRRRATCAHCHGRGKLSDDSVQELLGRRLLPAFRARTGKFHGAGREDIDVRMLGRGRPFVFEVVGPRREDVDLRELLARFHEEEGHRVRCDDFVVVDRRRVAELKEAQHDKAYRVGIRVEGALDPTRVAALAGASFEVVQRTPQRVAHRRGDLLRARRVRIIELRAVPDDESGAQFEIDIETAHGTYVKEWVSGDDGRTQPSLGSLLCTAATCVRLDVLDILDGAVGAPDARRDTATAPIRIQN